MISSISVKDVFAKNFSTVSENDALSKCLDLFKKSARAECCLDSTVLVLCFVKKCFCFFLLKRRLVVVKLQLFNALSTFARLVTLFK